jgi:hypothetical protein
VKENLMQHLASVNQEAEKLHSDLQHKSVVISTQLRQTHTLDHELLVQREALNAARVSTPPAIMLMDAAFAFSPITVCAALLQGNLYHRTIQQSVQRVWTI